MEQIPTPVGTAVRQGLRDVRFAAALIGALLIVLGVLGLVPGVTTGDMLFGVFQVSLVMCLVNLVAGALGVIMSRNTISSRRFLLLGGAAYLLMWVYGVIANLNGASLMLLFGLSVVMIFLGAVFSRNVRSSPRSPS